MCLASALSRLCHAVTVPAAFVEDRGLIIDVNQVRRHPWQWMLRKNGESIENGTDLCAPK